MDADTLDRMLRGYELARRLEAELCGGRAPNTGLLRAICREISVVFGAAAEKLGQWEAAPPPPPTREPVVMLHGGVPEGGRFAALEAPPVEGPTPILAPEILAATPTTAVGGSSQRASRKRKEGEHTTTIRVPVPRQGNPDLPPDDGYTWRKYGQKDILNARFPRSYYRCTHKSFYGCNARKQVQRLDDNPFIYEVTYCGDHTCQTSTTPLFIPVVSVAPPPPAQQLGLAWPDVEGSSRSVPQSREMDWPPVTDIAGAMFASGSSGLDAIFDPHKPDKSGSQ